MAQLLFAILHRPAGPGMQTSLFEVNDGLITFWRDYFDNGMFIKALKGE